MAKKIHLLIIDPQYDFMDNSDSALAVPNGNRDMDRVALLLKKHRRKIDDVKVTLDSHQAFHIAHPIFWVNNKGEHPAAMVTVIRHDDVVNGIWNPTVPALRKHALWYTKELERKGNYLHTIWNPHCLIGTPGHNVQANLNDALQEWATQETALINYVTKGSNYLVEHFGGLEAEVPLNDDPGTQLNTDLLKSLQEADEIPVAGEAFSHCVKATVSQIVANIGAEHVRKLHLLTDCMTCIPKITGPKGETIIDFPSITAAWVKDMEKLGLTVTTSERFFN